jgi:hypothetical protein
VNMLEKAARAAAEAIGDDYDDLPIDASQPKLARNPFGMSQEVLCDIARAVLAAIREPDEATVQAGWHAQPSGPCCDWDMQSVWQAMIDAILEGESK